MTASPTASRIHGAAAVESYLGAMLAMRRRFERALPDDLREELEGVTPHQCEALVWVAANGATTMHDLARHQAVSLSSCTALVDRLQRQGMVERGADPSDRRIVRVVPTDRAVRLAERFRAHKRHAVEAALGVLSPQELETLVGLIRRMVDADLPAAEPGAEQHGSPAVRADAREERA